jgi:putative protease
MLVSIDNMPEKILIGKVRKYYDKIGVIAVDLTGEVGVGDRISIEKDSKKVEQKVKSIQIEHIDVNKGFSGDSIGIKVDEPVEEDSDVYKLV